MIQTTSVAAYVQAEKSGNLDTWRERIFRALQDMPHSTAGEVFERLKETYGLDLRYDSNTHARFSELRDRKRIVSTGTRKCKVTSVECLTWARRDLPGVVEWNRPRPIIAKLQRIFETQLRENYGEIAFRDATAMVADVLRTAEILKIKL